MVSSTKRTDSEKTRYNSCTWETGDVIKAPDRDTRGPRFDSHHGSSVLALADSGVGWLHLMQFVLTCIKLSERKK